MPLDVPGQRVQELLPVTREDSGASVARGQGRRRFPGILLAALALPAFLLVAGCGREGSNPQDPDPEPIDSCLTNPLLCPEPNPPGPRNCALDPVRFSSPLIDPSVLKVVTPIGQVGGGNTEIIGRSYVFPKDEVAGQWLTLTAPADMEVVSAGHYIPPGAPTVEQGYVPDWVLLISLGCGLQIELYHVKNVSDSIKAAMYDTAITAQSGYLQLRRKVKIAAGQPFGAYIKGLNSGAFDFIVRNDSVTNSFANQARYLAGPSNLLHVVCPYALFEGATKAAYQALLGTVSGVPIPGAGCGTVERDKEGTPAGQWFLDSAFAPGVLASNRKEGDYGTPLPLMLGPDSTVYIGHTGPIDNIRIARANASWKDPGTITTEWCYQAASNSSAPDGWLWLKMVRADKMNVAYGSTGACPSTFPASGFKTYYR
jgi:hypothetical protein